MHTIYRVILSVLCAGTCSIAFAQVPETVKEPETAASGGVLIDHAFTGSTVDASNYEPGGIPTGIGIPHTLINSLAEGDYVAVEFFVGLTGCPSDNYEINAFRANAYWGYDMRGPNGPFSKAFSSAGGGCMQEFHIDPAKGGDWLWGALSNTGTSSAIADVNGIPAFAICATKEACDPIVPHGQTSAPPNEPAASTTPRVSNVLFLPGIKGSRLYTENPLCLIPSDSCNVSLWLPLADTFTPQLFMDSHGKSLKNIYVRDRDILASAFGQHFYDSFTQVLDDAKARGLFGAGWEWKSAAYDWRLSLPDIIGGGVRRGDHIYYGEHSDTPYLRDTLVALASSSPTHKVTIIAHSNGGLVAKALMQTLGNILSAQLIDSVVFVGVPQSGAPRALGALLYGDSEGIPGIRNLPNFIMSTAHAREFGLNSPMAYHLLPSARYLADDQPEHPLVKFEDGALFARERTAYGSNITTPAELQSFALAKDGGRTMPASNDLSSANVLNPELLAYAEQTHAQLDVWQPPHSIPVYQVGGYGVDTISGIDFYGAPHKDGPAVRSYRPLFTEDGDGTVPVISSLMMNASTSVHQVWLNLSSMKTAVLAYSHANLLESPEVQIILKGILMHLPIPEFVHAAEVGPPREIHTRFGFFVHSDVSVAVDDGHGHITSIGPNDSTEDIPHSTASTFGDVKYVIVPADQGVAYTLRVTGESAGSFTLDLQELSGDDVTASSTIADVPVTSKSTATIHVQDSIASASPLELDEDGDGTVDSSVPLKLGETVFPPDMRATLPVPVSLPSKIERVVKALTAPLAFVEEHLPVIAPVRTFVQKAVAPVVYKKLTQPVAKPATPSAMNTPSVKKVPPELPESFLSHLWRIVQWAAHSLTHFFRAVLTGQ